ncbi:MAG: hypothetical protein COA90_00860 [Gammaproteobacteria bacterium]|nr:MAG: hypothetical protein COA90_00860 [Gammaproteobacteria bacterium]
MAAKKEEQKATPDRIEKKGDKVIVILNSPIKRDGVSSIVKITLNEPVYKQLEQFSISDLDQVAVLPVLIPRIADEELFESDFDSMKMSDLIPLSMALAAFM